MSTLAILLCLVWIVADLGSLSTYFLVVKVIVHRADFPADSGERELSINRSAIAGPKPHYSLVLGTSVNLRFYNSETLWWSLG